MMIQRFFVTSMLCAGLMFGTGAWADNSIQMTPVNPVLMASAGDHHNPGTKGHNPCAKKNPCSKGDSHNSEAKNKSSSAHNPCSKGNSHNAKARNNSSSNHSSRNKGSSHNFRASH